MKLKTKSAEAEKVNKIKNDIKELLKAKSKSAAVVGRAVYRNVLLSFLVLGATLAAFALIVLIFGTIGYFRTKATYDDANSRFVTIRSKKAAQDEEIKDNPGAVSYNAVSENEAEDEGTIEVDLAALREVNKEVIGWIYFEDGLISYPVLFSGDNDKYLKRNYKEQYMASGSIFMDQLGSPDFSDHYTLLYGHNMRDLTMFGKLRYYRTDKNYYKDHEYFRIITEDHEYRYRIFSFRQVNVEEGVYTVIEKDDTGLEKLANNLLIPGSAIETEVSISDYDHVLALSTCVNDYAFRFVVCAVRVDDKVKNTVSSNVVLPKKRSEMTPEELAEHTPAPEPVSEAVPVLPGFITPSGTLAGAGGTTAGTVSQNTAVPGSTTNGVTTPGNTTPAGTTPGNTTNTTTTQNKTTSTTTPQSTTTDNGLPASLPTDTATQQTIPQTTPGIADSTKTTPQNELPTTENTSNGVTVVDVGL